MEYKDRIKAARKHAKLTQADLAKAVGITQTSVSDLERGKSVSSSFSASIARACGVNALWLEREEGAMVADLTLVKKGGGEIDAGTNVVPVAMPPKKRTKYPVISWVRAGDWAESPDNFQPGEAEEWLESEEKAGPHGYWLEVEGDSMLPLFPEGSRLLIQPEGFDLISGKYYVAIFYDPGRVRDTTVKQYVRDAGFEYLKPLNPTYRTLEVSENVRIIGRVVDYKLPPGVL